MRWGPCRGLQELFSQEDMPGVIFSDGFFKTFQVAYLRMVEDTGDEDNIQAKSRFYASYIYNFSKP